MPQHRAALSALLRPEFKPGHGFNRPGFLAKFDAVLDAAGVPRDDAAANTAPAAGSAPLAAPTAPTAASLLVGPIPVPVAMIDAALLKVACPENSLEELAKWVDPTKAACLRWGIDTLREVASFLANIGVESRGLTRLEENLNYSAKRMAEVWKRFAINPGAQPKDRLPNDLARSLAHNPEKLANHVYGGRMGNGPPESGDGWRHRGFGPKQLTGYDNHRRFAEAFGIPVQDVPAYLQTKEGGMMSAGWFWFDNDLDAKAATAGIEDDRQAINGGQTGVDQVRVRFNALITEMLRRERQAA